MNLTTKQKEIINSTEPRIAVRAAAAAGKTTVLTEKVRKLIQDGVEPSTIAVITYTRMAAANLVERLGNDMKDGLYVGTVHSLAARFLKLNGMGAKIGEVAEDEEFDELFSLCRGLDIKKSYDWILLDEAQDSTPEQLSFIFDMIDPDNFFVVYDDRQTLYVNSNSLKYRIMKTGAKTYSLNENFRNGSNILKYAKTKLSKSDLKDDSLPMKGITGVVVEEEFNDDLLNLIKPNEYKNWVILTPQNKYVKLLLAKLKKKGIPAITFKQGNVTKKQLDKIMNDNKVKVLTIHSSKGLEWPNVIVYGANDWMMFRLWYSNYLQYVAATRAKDNLYWTTKN